MCQFGWALHSCNTPVIFSCRWTAVQDMGVVHNRSGGEWEPVVVQTLLVVLLLLYPAVLLSPFALSHAVFKAEGVCLWSFPAQKLAIVRDELLHIFR